MRLHKLIFGPEVQSYFRAHMTFIWRSRNWTRRSLEMRILLSPPPFCSLAQVSQDVAAAARPLAETPPRRTQAVFVRIRLNRFAMTGALCREPRGLGTRMQTHLAGFPTDLRLHPSFHSPTRSRDKNTGARRDSDRKRDTRHSVLFKTF